MAAHEHALAEVHDPDGRVVVLLERIWAGKIVADHPELAGYLDEVLETVCGPDHVEPDARPDRRRYYRRAAGPRDPAAGLEPPAPHMPEPDIDLGP